MMPDTQSLIAELDGNLSHASSAQNSSTLRRLTNLFLASAETYSSDHVAVFDEVIGHLMAKSDRAALIELSAKLALVDNAPMQVVARLSSNDDVDVSEPLLCASGALTDNTLVEIARTKGQRHLGAIAGRPNVSNAVTDILVDRGDPEVIRKMVANQGALLSELGFVKLINQAKADKALAAAIASRTDVPPELQPFLNLTLG